MTLLTRMVFQGVATVVAITAVGVTLLALLGATGFFLGAIFGAALGAVSTFIGFWAADRKARRMGWIK